MQVWKLWLGCLCNPRAELLEIGREIDEGKEKLRLHVYIDNLIFSFE